MTPFPPNEDDSIQPRSGPDRNLKETTDQLYLDTPANLQNETPQVTDDSVADLPDELSEQERAQARAALAFLGEVRKHKHLEQPGDHMPKSIGKYSIVRTLGRGGFAEVFLARDEELDRRVALKVPLFNSTTNKAARQRFEREARLAASLSHPQIVPVYEYGDLGPIRFIAFAWCDGPTLGQWIEEHQPLDFRTIAKIVECLAQAVQHAHQRGIIHRDIKLGNVLVDQSSESKDKPVWERLRITDFGLARNYDSQDATLTQDGQLVGTPAYMAPEQAGSGAEVGPAADVWALGMILFELITGKLPFRKPELMATIKAICDQPVPRAKKLRHNVPDSLDAIADLCLRKNPADRYESAHALAEDLRRFTSGQPVRAKSPSALSTLAMWIRRNPVLATSIGSTIAALAIGLGVALWQRNAAINNLIEAQAQANRADGNLQTAQAVIKGVVELEKKLRTQTQLSKERADLVEQIAAFQIALVEDEQQTPEVRYETAMSLRELSTVLFQLGKYESSHENAQHVVSLLTGLENDLPEDVGIEDIFSAKIQQRLRMIAALNVQNRLDESLEICEATESEAVPEGLEEFRATMMLAENLRAKAMIQQRKGDTQDAAATMRETLDRIEGVSPGEAAKPRWDYAISKCRLRMTLAACEMELGEMELAEDHFLQSLEDLETMKELFPNHDQVPANEGLICFQLGATYEKLKNWTEAIKYYRQGRTTYLEMFDQNPKFTNPGNVYLLCSLALARSYAANGDTEESQAVATETTRRVSTFPDQLKSNRAFKDNLKAIGEYLK